MHRFLRVKGGFLSVDVDSEAKTINFKHHAVNGEIVNQENFAAK